MSERVCKFKRGDGELVIWETSQAATENPFYSKLRAGSDAHQRDRPPRLLGDLGAADG